MKISDWRNTCWSVSWQPACYSTMYLICSGQRANLPPTAASDSYRGKGWGVGATGLQDVVRADVEWAWEMFCFPFHLFQKNPWKANTFNTLINIILSNF